jgi:transcription-repair coupling factor (superfamily II helicase)
MQWTAKYFDNVYLLTDEQPHLTDDLVVYVLPEDKTVVIDHEAINHEVMGERTKVLWCYEPGRKLAGKTTYAYMPYVMSVAAQTIGQDLIPVQPIMSRYFRITVNEDFYLPINDLL